MTRLPLLVVELESLPQPVTLLCLSPLTCRLLMSAFSLMKLDTNMFVCPFASGSPFSHVRNNDGPQDHKDALKRECCTILARVLEYGDVPGVWSRDLIAAVNAIPCLQHAISVGLLVYVSY